MVSPHSYSLICVSVFKELFSTSIATPGTFASQCQHLLCDDFNPHKAVKSYSPSDLTFMSFTHDVNLVLSNQWFTEPLAHGRLLSFYF